jgi:hypothetical protein
MKKEIKKILVLLILAAVAVGPINALATDKVTIQGTVDDNYQLVDDEGQIYEIADTTQGNELAENHIGEKVKVTGTLEKDDDYQVIVVTTFEALAE